MSKANRARIKKLSNVNFKLMTNSRKKRKGIDEFNISHDQINSAIQSYLNRGGKITYCAALDQPPTHNFSGETDNFLMSV